jgi:DNA polymerase elongation subunit (family B)
MSTVTATPATAAVKATSDKVNLTNNVVARSAVEALREARATIKRAEAIKAEAERIIRDALGDAHQGVVLGNVVVKISDPIQRRSIDMSTLVAAYPEAYDQTLRVTEYTQVRTI